VKIATLSNAAAVHTRRWVEHFRARGHEVRLWSLERGPASLAAHPLPAAPLPGALRYPLVAPALRRALLEFAPDVVDAHYVPNYGMLGALCGVRPLVVSAWGSDLLVSAPRGPLERARARFVLTRADRVIADSTNLAAAAVALGAPADRVLELPWGVDLTRFHPSGSRTAGRIVSTRMHEPLYDLPTVIRGVAPVLASRSETHVVFAGDGSQRRELERLAAELLPAGRFEFCGSIESAAMATLLAGAEVFVSASRSDSTSVSLLEAMACGAVPVLSDLEGNREWVREGEGARLFPVGDAAALARAITTTLDDAAWRAAARERNATVIAKRGDSSANLGRVEALFEELAASRGQRHG
jgi:glycosyltransferase involved in cell wall biosynthesis